MTDAEIIAKAHELYANDDVDVLDIEPDHIDGGAWVRAVVFVPYETCEICGTRAATRYVEEPEIPGNSTFVCDECLARYVGGRVEQVVRLYVKPASEGQ